MKKILMAALLAAGSWTALSAQTQVIAHRGYWDCDGSAQNSIAALVKAAEAGAYGSEFDVSITADGVPVVNHDDDIQGHVIETTDYATIKDLKLPNGETLPTLEQYLAKGKETPGIRLVLEIKPHKLEANENRAVEAIVALVRKHGLEERTDYISFSMNICKQLVKQARSEGEDAKISVRNARRDAIEQIKKLVKDGLPEDVGKDTEAEVQKIHDKYIKKVDEMLAEKEKEIMTV